MFDLKISKLLRNGKKNQKLDSTSAQKLLTQYNKTYNIGDVICLVGFYLLKNDERKSTTLLEIEELFRTKKVKCDDIKFDIKYLVVGEEHAYSFSKHGYIAFNDETNPVTIAVNRYPKFTDSYESQYLWEFIELKEYFKENPISNLGYIDYHYAISIMSENEVIPKRITKTLSVVANNYIGSVDVSL